MVREGFINMFPEKIVEILQKYQTYNFNELNSINNSISGITNQLKSVRSNLSKELSKLVDNDNINDKEQELLDDTKTLRNYIQSIQLLKIENKSLNDILHEEIAEEFLLPAFDKKVYPYLVSDDICPFCNCKMSRHLVHYQRIVDSNLKNESVMWNRCTACKRLFVLDYDAEEFDFNETNIVLNEEKYNAIPPIDIYSVIVLSNTLNCSSNHNTDDLIAKIPVLNEDGEISYLKINASYCYECKRFTILKNDFTAIKDIIMCKVIDETSDHLNNPENEFDIEQKRSILFQYGYNVQTKKNLSELQRHIILSSIIEAQIMNRRDVINHINTLIDRGSKISSWNNATQKWKEDKKFVSEYKSDTLPEVIFNNIILKYRKQNQ